MELNNHTYTPGVFFQCLAGASSGTVLQIKIDESDYVSVDEKEIKPTDDNG